MALSAQRKNGFSSDYRHRTKYSVGSIVTIRKDLDCYTLYQSDDGTIFESVNIPAHVLESVRGRRMQVRDIVDGRYRLNGPDGIPVIGLWVDGMFEQQDKSSESKNNSSAAFSSAHIKPEDMMPEVAEYFRTAGMTMEDLEEKFVHLRKTIEQSINFQKVSDIAKLTREAHTATEEGRDPTELFDRIADRASDHDGLRQSRGSVSEFFAGVFVLPMIISVFVLLAYATNAAVAAAALLTYVTLLRNRKK